MPKRTVNPTLTPDRIARLCQFVQILGAGPKPRSSLVRKLKVNARGFYRDFQQLRKFGVGMEMRGGRYVLLEAVADALGRLPFPDPRLSVQEVLQLAAGKTPAHKKLRERIKKLLPM